MLASTSWKVVVVAFSVVVVDDAAATGGNISIKGEDDDDDEDEEEDDNKDEEEKDDKIGMLRTGANVPKNSTPPRTQERITLLLLLFCRKGRFPFSNIQYLQCDTIINIF